MNFSRTSYIFIFVFLFVSPTYTVQSPNSTCTHSSSSICDGHCSFNIQQHHDQLNSDVTFVAEETNNLSNMPSASAIEHQYEAIKDDREGMNGRYIEGSFESNDNIIHSDTCKNRQKSQNQNMVSRGKFH